MTEFAATSDTSRYDEKATHTVKRTIILTEHTDDKGPFATLDNRNDIYRILGLVEIRVKEIHTSVVTYNL
jgi:hypothetical protein